jgi:CheY-like chemotaxis protein
VPHTLLLADDSVTIQRVIELTFADEDVQVVAVGDGDQAIERLEASPPDIVLADIGMPGKNGYEVAQYMKQSPRLAHIPVLLLTGAFEPVDQARVAEAGCDGVLAKPFEPNLVIDRVRELLARPRQAGIAAARAPASPPASDHWPPPSAPQVVSRQAPPKPGADLNDYFDRLDAAFTDLTPAPDLPKLAPVAPPPAAHDLDWFETVDGPAPDLPQTANVTSPPIPPIPPAPPAVPASQLPSLADAFAALLAAEQSEPLPSVSSAWPGAASAAEVSDDVVEQVTRRVLDRLSDSVVKDTVADVVSSIAERLVREEIERIKASIK